MISQYSTEFHSATILLLSGALLAGFQLVLCWVYPRTSLPLPLPTVLGEADKDSTTAGIKTQAETSQAVAAVDSFRIPAADPLAEA